MASVLKIVESIEIAASADRVYGIIADYRDGHAKILPPRAFSDLVILAGGVGAGTRIGFNMHLLGTTTRLTADIIEPEPGRRLEEHIPDNASITAFVIEPIAVSRCRATIEMTMPAPGLKGFLTRMFLKRPLGKMFRDELRLLAELATSPA